MLAVAGLVLGAAIDLATADGSVRVRERLTEIGVPAPLRTLLRGVLAVPVVAVDTPVFVVAVAAVAVGGLIHDFALHRIVDFSPPLAARNLQAPEAGRMLAGLEVRKRAGTAWLLAGVIPRVGVAAVSAAPWAAAVVGGLGGAVGLAGVAALVWVRQLLRSPRLRAYRESLATEIAKAGADVVVHFSGAPATTYQLASWMPVLERLTNAVVIVVREREHLAQLPATRHPVIYAERPVDLEVLLRADPKVFIYVANAGRNFHPLRLARPEHIFLNHGDSDKASSANPVVKAYDRLFVAGQLGVQRYRDAGIDLPDDRFELVGRPQLDRVRTGVNRAQDGPATVLYAPTWEGYSDAADYSSIERMGLAIIEALLAIDGIRVVFKPHPMTGDRRPAARAAVRTTTERVRAAGAPHVVASDEPDVDLYGWFDASQAMITDVSAVVTDYLHTQRPYLVTNPRGFEIADFERRFPTHVAGYVVAAADDVRPMVALALGDDPKAAERQAMRVRVLGNHPQGPQAAFQQAIDRADGDPHDRVEVRRRGAAVPRSLHSLRLHALDRGRASHREPSRLRAVALVVGEARERLVQCDRVVVRPESCVQHDEVAQGRDHRVVRTCVAPDSERGAVPRQRLPRIAVSPSQRHVGGPGDPLAEAGADLDGCGDGPAERRQRLVGVTVRHSLPEAVEGERTGARRAGPVRSAADARRFPDPPRGGPRWHGGGV